MLRADLLHLSSRRSSLPPLVFSKQPPTSLEFELSSSTSDDGIKLRNLASPLPKTAMTTTRTTTAMERSEEIPPRSSFLIGSSPTPPLLFPSETSSFSRRLSQAFMARTSYPLNSMDSSTLIKSPIANPSSATRSRYASSPSSLRPSSKAGRTSNVSSWNPSRLDVRRLTVPRDTRRSLGSTSGPESTV